MNPPLPNPSKTIVMGNTQQIEAPKDVVRPIIPGFISVNCMISSYSYINNFKIFQMFEEDKLKNLITIVSSALQLSDPEDSPIVFSLGELKCGRVRGQGR
jgi:hypothetical protein